MLASNLNEPQDIIVYHELVQLSGKCVSIWAWQAGLSEQRECGAEGSVFLCRYQLVQRENRKWRLFLHVPACTSDQQTLPQVYMCVSQKSGAGLRRLTVQTRQVSGVVRVNQVMC